MENAHGITTIPSSYSLDETLAKLQAAIAQKGLILFAHIDHTAGAAEVGLRMQPAHVLIFGSPKAGTPLMVARPLLALDLPLKVLVWRETDGSSQVSFNTPEFLAQRHAIPAELVKNISGIEPLIKAALA